MKLIAIALMGVCFWSAFLDHRLDRESTQPIKVVHIDEEMLGPLLCSGSHCVYARQP